MCLNVSSLSFTIGLLVDLLILSIFLIMIILLPCNFHYMFPLFKERVLVTQCFKSISW